jgi:hypothetical protein
MYLLVSAVSVSMLVAGVVEYFCRQRIDVANQKSELRITTLESELTSIRRGMDENKYLDIRSFVYPKDRFALLRPNPKAKYVPDDSFYAILDLPGWQYESTSLEKFFRAETGNELWPITNKMLGKNRVYAWRATDALVVKGPNDYS